jgi:hypothetical protein
MYPGGSAVQYLEEADWGGDHDEYLAAFVSMLERDWLTWQQMVAAAGDAAEWRQVEERLITPQRSRRRRTGASIETTVFERGRGGC